ncbi:HNH endonuclease [Mesorhizobium sp. M0955]|uniref:HNH endonuclease n=1 Tax=Mesorhizobium sp. M0955 TaxID=2957033 RepID=UPI00333D19A1
MEWALNSLERDTDACFSWPFAKNTNGYCRLTFRGINDYAHRVICLLKHGEPPAPDHEAAHSCGKGHEGCLNHRHLRWASRSENQRDRSLHQTDKRGERHHAAKATEEQAHTVKSLGGTHTVAQAARIAGISYGAAYHIIKGTAWSWLHVQQGRYVKDAQP